MGLVGAAAVSGVAVGFVYGMLAFSIVLLFKASGIPNFAQGNIATFGTFIVYLLAARAGLPLAAAIGLGFAGTAALGVVIYLGGMLPRGDAGTLNLAIRTLAIYLLLFAVMNLFWGVGQPFAFPRFLPAASMTVAGVSVSLLSLVTVAAAVVLGGAFWLLYNRTATGLLLRGIADRPEVARLLGADTARLSGLAWLLAGLVAVVVGLLTVPTALLSSDMMDSFFLYAFTAALLGGMTSLPGAFVGGVVVGVVSNVVTVLRGQEISILAIFALLIVILLVRPDGLFGHGVVERL
ncbi:MAG: branched-chain amino acid ABC transporter permease [Chloroflexi bacterium]|jgi:branched-chain amino acid transport system permease protein|nr:MAG: branched-chain amino acid ABC transporter permease [Chloroflexota bacterium]